MKVAGCPTRASGLNARQNFEQVSITWRKGKFEVNISNSAICSWPLLMLAAHRWLRLPPYLTNGTLARRFIHTNHDACGIPLEPTWSVDKLLSSYTKPTLSSTTLIRLHELSALIPPSEGTPEHNALKQEMEEFIRLVEAVKLVDTKGVHPAAHRNEENKDGQPSYCESPSAQKELSGRDLLKHASRTLNGFYVVDSDRKR